MNSVKIEWIAKTLKLSQANSSGLEFSWVTEDWKQIHQFVYCKDYLQDALCAHYNQKTMSIYGFCYNPQKDLPLYLEKTRLLISDAKNKKQSEQIESSLDFLNQIEKMLKLKRTQAFLVENPDPHYKDAGVYVYEGSKKWMLAPPMVSLYALLIRVSFVHVLGDTYDKTIANIVNGVVSPPMSCDRSFLRDGQKGLNLFIKYGWKKLFYIQPKNNYCSMDKTKTITVGTMHNYSGIQSYSNKNSLGFFPGWAKRLNDLEHPESVKPKKVKKVKE